jgi:hypothetical protein
MTQNERNHEVATPEFTLELSQQQYLSTSDNVMDAILRVTAGELGAVSTGVAAEVILLDCSSSMSVPMTKIAAARGAAVAAIEALRDGTYFAVVQGTDRATMCYPTKPRMAVADARTRAEAKEQINAMAARGGTAMGTWLTLARELFATTRATIRHAVLLTDGQNMHESTEQLERVLAECDGQFCCDARGIGTDWDPHELRRIAGVLRGACDAVRVEAELVDDFRALARAAMAKVVPDLRIRVTSAPGVELRGLKQVHPREADYTGNPARHDGPVWEFSTGAWAGHDSRDFQLSLRVACDDRDPIGEDLNAAFVELISEGAPDAVAAVSVLVHWTTDPVLSSRLDAAVAHYQGQGELTKAMLGGFDDFVAGRHEEAVRKWGDAVRLATESANTEALTRLARLVDVIDAEQGIVRLKPNVSQPDLLSSAAGADMSSRSWDSRKQQPVNRDATPQATAPCGHTVPSTAKFCGECGRRVDGLSR